MGLAVQVIFVSVLAHTCAATDWEGIIAQEKPHSFRRHAVHLAPTILQQPRGLIWDWLVGGSQGVNTTPRPDQRPGDRQDEAGSSTGDLTGTWILGYPAYRAHWAPNSVPGVINYGYPQGSNGLLHPWWPAVYPYVQK